MIGTPRREDGSLEPRERWDRPDKSRRQVAERAAARRRGRRMVRLSSALAGGVIAFAGHHLVTDSTTNTERARDVVEDVTESLLGQCALTPEICTEQDGAQVLRTSFGRTDYRARFGEGFLELQLTTNPLPRKTERLSEGQTFTQNFRWRPDEDGEWQISRGSLETGPDPGRNETCFYNTADLDRSDLKQLADELDAIVVNLEVRQRGYGTSPGLPEAFTPCLASG